MKRQYYYIIIPIIAVFLILIGIKFFFSYKSIGDEKTTSHSSDIGEKSAFYNTKYNETNVRMGPGYDYPIKFKITTPKYPLKEIIKYGDWIKIVDFEDDEGWVYKNLVSSPKASFVIILNSSFVYSSPKTTSKKIAKVGKYNVALIQKISDDFIKIKINGISGWISRHNIWGKL